MWVTNLLCEEEPKAALEREMQSFFSELDSIGGDVDVVIISLIINNYKGRRHD